MSAAQLYTPEVLAAAVSLADLPLTADLPLRGSARSSTCGSYLEIGLAVDDVNRIAKVGLAAHACAIGQACAAIFAREAAGRTAGEVRDARDAMATWLAGKSEIPDWPGLTLVAKARGYPARHGAMMLAWDAACRALDEMTV